MERDNEIKRDDMKQSRKERYNDQLMKEKYE